MKKYIYFICGVILLSMVLPFAGCQKNTNSEQDTPKFNKKVPTEQVTIVHLENLKTFLSEDAEGIANAFSANYLDMFRSMDGRKADVSKTYFISWFKSINFEACKILKLDELVDVRGVKVYTYDEIMKMNPVAVGVKNVVGFQYKEGDILIKFPAKQNSPMINGWIGVYRKENNYWKIVAGNF